MTLDIKSLKNSRRPKVPELIVPPKSDFDKPWYPLAGLQIWPTKTLSNGKSTIYLHEKMYHKYKEMVFKETGKHYVASATTKEDLNKISRMIGFFPDEKILPRKK